MIYNPGMLQIPTPASGTLLVCHRDKAVFVLVFYLLIMWLRVALNFRPVEAM